MYSDTGAPLHEERVITVRQKAEFYILRSISEMSQVECGHPVVSCGSEHVTLHVLLTAQTKDPINEELLMKMPKDATLINVACPDRDT